MHPNQVPIFITQDVFFNASLDLTDKILHGYLGFCAARNEEISVNRIAVALGLSANTIRKSLRSLYELDLINRSPRYDTDGTRLTDKVEVL